MDVLEKVVDVDVESSKEDLINRILAAGLNSLATSHTEADKALLNTFVSKSFDRILPCWDLINDRIRFQIFKVHISEFEEFMRERAEEGK